MQQRVHRQFLQSGFRLGGILILLLVSLLPVFGQGEPLRLQGALVQLANASNYSPEYVNDFAGQRGIEIENERVLVIVEAVSIDETAMVETRLNSLGAEGIATYQHLIQAQVPIQQLSAISRLKQVGYVRLPATPSAAAMVSEGVSLIGADDFFDVGLTGNGIKIAVIDLGFDGLGLAMSSRDLPNNVQEFDFTNQGMGGIAHGTAVAEIVHDVAPGAQLLIMKVSNEVQLGQAVEEALRQGVRIINHSVVWFNTEFGDGTGEVAQIASQAANRGVLWVNAAGNTALQHWQGGFRDLDDDSWVEFDNLGSESLPLDADEGQVVEIFLNWDAWPQTSFDYDLFLIFDGNRNGLFDQGEIFVSSADAQRGLDPPMEHIRLITPFTGKYLISIWYKGSSPPPDLELFTTNHTLRTPVREGSVLAPATAANVLSVGAVNYREWGSGFLESFSSRGPTSDGRVKPDLVGPDDVVNLIAARFPFQFGATGRFIGTSAAAPHVAGAAALLLEETLGMTASQAFLYLTRNALNLPPSSPNNLNGFGKINLQLAPTDELDLVLSDFEVSDTVVSVGETISVNLEARNPHRRIVTATVALEVDGRVVSVIEVTLNPNETRQVTFSWQFEVLGTFSISAANLGGISIRVVESLNIQSVQLFAQDNHALRLDIQGQGIENIELGVYDLAGTQVLFQRSDSATLIVPFFNRFGAPLANGVYLYSLSIRGITRTERLPMKKLLVLF